MDTGSIVIIIASLLCSAFFSGSEIAFVSANKLQMKLDSKAPSPTGIIISLFLKYPSRFIGIMLVGNTLSLVIYGIYMGAFILRIIDPEDQWIESLKLLVQTTISTLIILITAEFIPKTIFRINPNRLIKLFAFLHIVIYMIFWIPMIIIIGLSEWLVKITFKSGNHPKPVGFGRVDLEHYVQEMTEHTPENQLMDHEVKIFKNALGFSNVKSRDCMIPRTDIVAMSLETTIEELCNKFIHTGFSKILIYDHNIDNIIGYVHSAELFKKPVSVKSMLLPISNVPEALSAIDLLNKLVDKNRSIAVVVDEFGGTAGLVTIEDVIEEIIGEIEDEHDIDNLLHKKISENKFLLSGNYEVATLNEKYDLTIPESDEYETVAGYIINKTESIPNKDAIVKIDDFEFKIIAVSEKKIEKVLLRLREK